jgi:hypothetical protein
MAGKSPRDQCFGDGVDAYNDAHPNDKLPVDSQKPWVLDNGAWRPATAGERIWNWIRGGDPFRVFDWTATIDGKPVVGDNKFEGDGYSNRKGRSGKTQLEDQNDVNTQNHPDKPEYQDLHLNPDKCNCDGDPEPEEVYEPALAPGSIMVPGINPVFGGAAAAEEAAAAEAILGGVLAPAF